MWYNSYPIRCWCVPCGVWVGVASSREQIALVEIFKSTSYSMYYLYNGQIYYLISFRHNVFQWIYHLPGREVGGALSLSQYQRRLMSWRKPSTHILSSFIASSYSVPLLAVSPEGKVCYWSNVLRDTCVLCEEVLSLGDAHSFSLTPLPHSNDYLLSSSMTALFLIQPTEAQVSEGLNAHNFSSIGPITWKLRERPFRWCLKSKVYFGPVLTPWSFSENGKLLPIPWDLSIPSEQASKLVALQNVSKGLQTLMLVNAECLIYSPGVSSWDTSAWRCVVWDQSTIQLSVIWRRSYNASGDKGCGLWWRGCGLGPHWYTLTTLAVPQQQTRGSLEYMYN